MIVGARIEERRKALNIKSQNKLAQLLGMSQSTLNGLIHGSFQWSPHLPKLARELRTSIDYLIGETDDPDPGALPPAPAGPIVVTMGVVLPPERALVAMFEALLAGIDPEAPRGEQALLLAQRLPIGLSQLRDLLPDEVTPARELAEAVADVATPYRPRPR